MTPARLGPGHVRVDDTRIGVLDHGDVNAGTTIVLLHGWGSSSAAWSSIIPLLAVRHRVLAVDLRGHGASELGREPVTVDRIVADVNEVTRAAGATRRVVVGHSLGGTVATALAIEDPSVAGLVVIDPSYGADPVEMAGARDRLSDYRVNGGQTAAREVAAVFAVDSDPALLVSAEHSLLATPARALAELFASNYLDSGAVGPEASARTWIAGRRVPTLAFFPDEYRARVDRASGATIEVWPGAGHFLHQQRPRQFAETVLDWVDGVLQP